MFDFKFSDKDEQIDCLVEFLDTCAQSAEEYRCEHDDSGSDYLDAFMDSICVRSVQERSRHSSHLDAVAEVIQAHMDRGVSERKIEQAMKDIGQPESAGMFCVPNAVESCPVGEIEDQVSSIGGTVNGIEVECVLTALTTGLTASEKEQVSRKLSNCTWNYEDNYCPDYIYINTDTVWYFVVDPDALDELLAEIEVPDGTDVRS